MQTSHYCKEVRELFGMSGISDNIRNYGSKTMVLYHKILNTLNFLILNKQNNNRYYHDKINNHKNEILLTYLFILSWVL